MLYIGGRKGIPQNQKTEIILLGIRLKNAKRLIYSNRTLKHANEQLKNVFLKVKKNYVVGMNLAPSTHSTCLNTASKLSYNRLYVFYSFINVV